MKCRECRKQFTVRKGTIFEESHIEMFKWLQAIHLMVSSKKGISSHQLHRVLEIKQKSAWFMAHQFASLQRLEASRSPQRHVRKSAEMLRTFRSITPCRPECTT